jgi:hypothetical protein
VSSSNPHESAPAATPHATSASEALTPAPVAAGPLEKLADGRVALGPFALQVPAGWTERPHTSPMRVAEFQLPAAGGGEAELIVYYFGAGGAGSVQDNVDRWLSQFKQPDGKASGDVAKVEKAQFAGQEASLVSVSGHYVAAAMPGGEPVDKPDQALLAAVVGSPQGPYYFRLIGAQAVVAANTAPFREALSSLKLRQ